jgi:hypothetical protein
MDRLILRQSNLDVEITEQQEALRFQLASIEGKVFSLKNKRRALLKGHKCIAGPRKRFDPDEKWFSSGGACIICSENHDWWCPKSDDGICEFDSENDPSHDFCLHCGQPEERK